MIGLNDSTPDRWRTFSGRSAALVAIAALIVFVGATSSTASAQTPGSTLPDQLPADPGAPLTLPPPSPSGVPSEIPPPKPVPADSRAPMDAKVRPVEVEADTGPIPPAKPASGGEPQANPGGSSAGPDPFFLPIDRMSPGKQRVQITVDVQASPIVNLSKETTVRLVVFNESNVDAAGVSLVYQLPESLKLNSSTPEATPIPGKPQFQWSKPMLAAGSEWVVILKVTPISTKPAEHAATVTVKTGSKAITTIQEPKLKVEVLSSPGRVLKGEPVNFQITVRNPGTGPARNVIVQARLSSGLRSGSDDIVEQTIPEIGPGQSVPLDNLQVDTIAGGEQTCTVDVRSNDVIPVLEDQRVTRPVEVTKPDLQVKIDGQTERFTGQTNEYKLSVHNPGTAPAKKVKVVASLPREGGRMIGKPAGAFFDVPTRKLVWSIAQLEPGQTVDMSFVYETNAPGLYRANIEATSADLRASDSISTEVSGIAVLDLKIEQDSRVMDVGKNNVYDITIENVGTKEATKLGLSGKLMGPLKVVKSYNVEKGQVVSNPNNTGEFLFPVIERLAVGQKIMVSIEVQATASGPAGCHVFLGHAEMATDEAKVEDVISTTITGSGRPKSSTKKPGP